MRFLWIDPRGVARIAACIAGILLLSVARSSSESWTATIRGVVRDVNQAPMSHVRVFIYAGPSRGAITSTDARGTFRIVGVEPGTYEMIFSHDGYDSRLARFDLCPNEIADVSPMLLSQQTMLDLRVYGKEARFANTDSAEYSVNGIGSRFAGPRACF